MVQRAKVIGYCLLFVYSLVISLGVYFAGRALIRFLDALYFAS